MNTLSIMLLAFCVTFGLGVWIAIIETEGNDNE